MIGDSEVLTARYLVAVVVVVVKSAYYLSIYEWHRSPWNPCHLWMECAISGRMSRQDVWKVQWEFLPSMDGRVPPIECKSA